MDVIRLCHTYQQGIWIPAWQIDFVATTIRISALNKLFG